MSIHRKVNYIQQCPEAVTILNQMEKYLAGCFTGSNPITSEMIELVKIRVSQLNGCAYCIDMHTKDARANHESEQRLYALTAWKETPFYSDAERAALAWAEANTLIASRPVSDELFFNVREYFSEAQLVNLTLVITSINSWNRVALSFKPEVGSYQPGDFDV